MKNNTTSLKNITQRGDSYPQNNYLMVGGAGVCVIGMI